MTALLPTFHITLVKTGSSSGMYVSAGKLANGEKGERNSGRPSSLLLKVNPVSERTPCARMSIFGLKPNTGPKLAPN